MSKTLSHDKSNDPLYQRYSISNTVGFGSYGIVYDATCKATGIAKAIKALDGSVCKSGSASVEIDVLHTCNHPNVVKLEEIIEAVEGRACIALVFPAYDMDLGKLLRLRRGFPHDFPMQHKYCIAQGLWNGLQYMHSMELLHRDIKPANILLAFGSEVRAVLADMGLACAVVSGKPNIVVGDRGNSFEMHRTANVCTSAYVAPELLCAQIHRADTSYYGYGVDIWSAAAVSFELGNARLERYCRRFSSPGDQFSAIVQRLGKPPQSFGRLPEAFRKITRECRSTPGALDLTEPWLSLVRKGIQWRPEDRATAKDIAGCFLQDLRLPGAVTSSATSAPSPAAEGTLAPASSEPVRASPRDFGNPQDCSGLTLVLGRPHADIAEVPLPQGSTCGCTGGCGQPLHSRHRCKRAVTVLGGSRCSLCTCSWLGCTSPRLWGKHCKMHQRKLQELSIAWQVVIAAGALNCQLVPVDAIAFCDFFDRHRTSLRELVTIAFVKEPQATTMFDEELRQGAGRSKADLRKAWMRVVDRVLECGQDKEALRNLTRQGVGRFSCLARVMTMIGIIEAVKSIPSTAAGDVFTLGSTGCQYRFCRDASKFDAFYDAFEAVDAQWQQIMQKHDELQGEFDFKNYCEEVRSVLVAAGIADHSFGLKAEGYCFDFAYRKIVIAEARRRKDEVKWETSMCEIQKISADSGELLDEIDTDVVSVALSHAIFGRTDWPIMLSCFACLWSEVVTRLVESKVWKLADLLSLLRSGKLSSIVADYRQAHGFAPHPFVLMEIYMQSQTEELHPTPRMKKRGVSSTAPTKEQLTKKSKKMRVMETSN